MKKVLSLILSAIMLLSILPVMAFAEETYIPVSEANSFWSDRTYSISSEEEFMLFVKKCYNTLVFSDFVLTTDLTFYDGVFSLDENQTPLYNGGFILPEPIEVLHQFKGCLDGQGHTISGLYVNDEICAGLFGEASGRISNVNITNSLFVSEEKAGSIAGKSFGVSIENCSSDAIVIGKSTVGGIVSDAQHGSISDCFFSGTVVLEKGGNAQTKNVGGIIGSVHVNMINCVNAGDVYNKANGYYCGGVAGQLSTTHNSENEYLSEVVGCANTGRVFSKSPAGNFAGCIIGGHIVDCYAAGEVYSEKPSNFMAEFRTNKKPVGNYWDSEKGFYDNFINCYYVARYGDTVDFNGEFNTHYEWYLKSRKPDPEDGTLVIDDIGISPIEEETLRNNISGESTVFESLVCDTGNENKGYPLPESLQRRTVAPSITDIEYTKSYETRNTFNVTVEGRPAMIQFIEPTGGTRTYDRNHKNVTIKSYDAEGNEVNSLDRTAVYEVWSIYSNMMINAEIRTRAKYFAKAKYTWDSETFDFSMILANPIVSMKLDSYSGAKGAVPATIVVDSQTEKVMIKMPDGSSATLSTFTTDENGNRVFNSYAWMNADGLNEIKVYIRRDNAWKLAGIFEYTAS